MKRIHIVGPVGSGKTTFARRISQEMGVKHTEIDNVVWERQEGGDRRRSEKERDALLERLTTEETWVIEGTHIGWTEPCFARADLILVMTTPKETRRRRIVLRFLKQVTGREQANYRPTVDMLRKMFRWSRDYETIHYAELRKQLLPYAEKVQDVDGRGETLDRIVRNLKSEDEERFV